MNSCSLLLRNFTVWNKLNQVEWHSSKDQRKDHRQASWKVYQSHPAGNVCWNLYNCWDEATYVGVFMELCCIERQAIVANNHSEPGKIKGKWKRFFHLSELSKDFSACMHFFQMQIEIILSIADLILWKIQINEKPKEKWITSFSKQSFLVKRQVIFSCLSAKSPFSRNPANSLFVNFIVVSLFSLSEDVSFSHYVPHCLHCCINGTSEMSQKSLWCLKTVYSQHKAEDECCGSDASLPQQVKDIVMLLGVCLHIFCLKDIKLVWLCEQGFFKKY